MVNEEHEITIHKMIIHKVDHRNYDAPQLSDLESPVSDEVASFLQQHIAANREHRYARTAVFEEGAEGDDTLRDTCDALLKDLGSFVPNSRIIATRLSQRPTNEYRPVIWSFAHSARTERQTTWHWLYSKWTPRMDLSAKLKT